MSEQIKVSDQEIEGVSGGNANYTPIQFATGTYVKYGTYIIYKIAAGDVLSAIASRFNVRFQEIAQWNNIKDPNFIRAGDSLTIYPR